MAHKPIPPNIFVIISIDKNYQYRALLGHEMNGVKRTNNKPLTTNCFLTVLIFTKYHLIKMWSFFHTEKAVVYCKLFLFSVFPELYGSSPLWPVFFLYHSNSATLHAWYMAMLAKQ